MRVPGFWARTGLPSAPLRVWSAEECKVTAAHHNFTAAGSLMLVGEATSPSRISAPGAIEPALRGVIVRRPRFGARHAGGAIRRGITPVPAL
jgi:hypothetical protein